MSRPLSEDFAITFVACTTCGAGVDEPCRGKFRPMKFGVHCSRRATAAELRRNNKKLYLQFKQTRVSPSSVSH